MLEWVYIHVIHMPPEIGFVTDEVFPITALPDTPLAAMQALVAYWRDGYDWRACEARLNALGQFKTEIDGLDIHFLHVRSPHAEALPLVLTHGWPGSVMFMMTNESFSPLTLAVEGNIQPTSLKPVLGMARMFSR